MNHSMDDMLVDGSRFTWAEVRAEIAEERERAGTTWEPIEGTELRRQAIERLGAK